jgi:hypothetical protein
LIKNRLCLWDGYALEAGAKENNANGSDQGQSLRLGNLTRTLVVYDDPVCAHLMGQNHRRRLAEINSDITSTQRLYGAGVSDGVCFDPIELLNSRAEMR